VPLVVDIHGYTENADKEQTRSHWDTLASTENFILAYPNGKNGAWNAQGQCCGNPGTTTEQDVQFIRDVVVAVKQAGRIRADRVYVTGTSNGGSMTHTMACMAADTFNGAGPVVFPLSSGTYSQVVSACKPVRPIALLTFQGDNDTLVPYNGGAMGILTAQDSRKAWAEIQHCSTTFTTTNPLSNVKCEIHSGCDGGVSTGLCTVKGGTHAGIYEEVSSPGVAGLIWNFWKSSWK
jgi:polyhydroxybutyrate depolymerase